MKPKHATCAISMQSMNFTQHTQHTRSNVIQHESHLIYPYPHQYNKSHTLTTATPLCTQCRTCSFAKQEPHHGKCPFVVAGLLDIVEEYTHENNTHDPVRQYAMNRAI